MISLKYKTLIIIRFICVKRGNWKRRKRTEPNTPWASFCRVCSTQKCNMMNTNHCCMPSTSWISGWTQVLDIHVEVFVFFIFIYCHLCLSSLVLVIFYIIQSSDPPADCPRHEIQACVIESKRAYTNTCLRSQIAKTAGSARIIHRFDAESVGSISSWRQSEGLCYLRYYTALPTKCA